MDDVIKAHKTAVTVHLLRMAMIDGHLSREEKDLFSDYCEELGLTRQEICASAKRAVDDELPLLPDDPRKRHAIFSQIVRIASCDGLETEEIQYLYSISGDFGLDQEDVDTIIGQFAPPPQ